MATDAQMVAELTAKRAALDAKRAALDAKQYAESRGWIYVGYNDMTRTYRVKTEMVLPRMLVWDGKKLITPDPH